MSLKNPSRVHLGALLGPSASPTCHGVARSAPLGLTTADSQHVGRGEAAWGAEGQPWGSGKEEEKQLKGRGGTSAASAGRRVLLPPARISSCKLRRHAAAPASWEVLLMPKQSWAGGLGGGRDDESYPGLRAAADVGSLPLPTPCFSGRGSETVIKSWSRRPSASDNLSARWQLLNSKR